VTEKKRRNIMRLYVIANGWNENDLANLVLNPHLGTDGDRYPRPEWVKAPIWSVLVETDDGHRILFDTASHPRAMSERWPQGQREKTPYHCPPEQELLPSLLRLGLSPDDIDIVVASHLHEDHAGGLEFFPQSTIYVHENEIKNTLLLHATTPEESMGAYIGRDIDQWLAAQLHWEVVESDSEDREIAQGVRLLNFGPGHTYGMLGLLVALPRTGNIILCSDAIMSAVNYGPPIQLNGFPYDSLGIVRTTRRVHALADRHRAQVWFGHDQAQFETLTLSDQGYYD
jgi:glyoxylase-like metal-dependent hydrolase (beta-lactamase superfamily II)